MLKKIFPLILTLTIILFFVTTIKLNSEKININNIKLSPIDFHLKKTNASLAKEEIYGQLIIPKLKINNYIYPIDSPNNNVDKNITILKNSIPPNKSNSIIFIAAHSGNGPTAFFKNLNKLTINDEIIFIYQNKNYTYQVTNIFEEAKQGFINIAKNKYNQLVLTTCSPTNNNKQLIINSVIKQ